MNLCEFSHVHHHQYLVCDYTLVYFSHVLCALLLFRVFTVLMCHFDVCLLDGA